MKATWDDSSESESEVEKMTRLGLMAHSDKEDEQDDEVYLKTFKRSKWYSRHITGDQSKLISFLKKDGGMATFGDNNKGKIIGKDNIGNHSSTLIENVHLIDGLKHDLFSIVNCVIKDLE